MRNTMTALVAIIALSVQAQTPTVNFKSKTLPVDSMTFKTEAVMDGLYNVYATDRQTQLQIPLYLPDSNKTYKLDLNMQDGCPMVANSNDNKALSAFNHLVYTGSRAYWTEGQQWTSEQILRYLKSYRHAADSLADA